MCKGGLRNMPTVEFGGKSFTVDEDGFIDDYTNWSEEWVQYVKKEEGIEELNEEHKKVVEVLREYYEKNGIAPMVRVLSQVRVREPVRWQVFRNPPDVCNHTGFQFIKKPRFV
jgi:TusE/DsrC/DsvC family sulfur relay protein